MEKSDVKVIVSITFLLIFVELSILYFAHELLLLSVMEVFSVLLVVLLYYFVVSSELRMALNSFEEALMRVEVKFEEVEKKFEHVKQGFDEDVDLLKDEIRELRSCVCSLETVNLEKAEKSPKEQ